MKTDDAERILKLLADSLEQGKDFALEQAPDIAQELILWKRVEWVCAVVIGLVACLLLYWACRLLWRRSKLPECKDFREGIELSSVVCGTLSCVALGIWLGCTISSLQVWFAPKLYILEYAANILKGG